MSYFKSLALAAVLVAGGVGTAAAVEASVALNIRSGPSTAYQVVDTLYAGENVNVQECRTNGWCAITHNGPDGWVSARYLSGLNAGSSSSNSSSSSNAQADISLSFGVPGFSFSIGNGSDFRDRPGRPDGRVCFYDGTNFTGARFCTTPGHQNPRMRGFNDRISSIKVFGDAQVRVCEDFNFGGRCAVLDSSRANLGFRNNNIISSYRVR